MRVTIHRSVARLALGSAVVLLLDGATALAEDGGAAGSVQSGMESAGDSTRRGLSRAGEAVGGAVDTAITTTGRGMSRALESTGNGIQRAGRAISGEPAPATQEEPAAQPAPQQPIQEEPLPE